MTRDVGTGSSQLKWFLAGWIVRGLAALVRDEATAYMRSMSE